MLRACQLFSSKGKYTRVQLVWERNKWKICFNLQEGGVCFFPSPKMKYILLIICARLSAGGILYRADSGETIWNAQRSQHLSNNIPHGGFAKDGRTTRRTRCKLLSANKLHFIHTLQIDMKRLGRKVASENIQRYFYCCCFDILNHNNPDIPGLSGH